MKRTFSLFFAAVLAAALLVCPAAAAPWAQVDGKGTDTQTISLQGLAGQYTGVQLTLNLSGTPSGVQFTQPASSGQGGFASCHQEGNQLTLYLSSAALLNQDGALSLGTVRADAGFTVSSISGLKLINVGPNPGDTQTVTYASVRMDNGSGSGSGGGGSWGGGGGGGYDPLYAVGTAPGVGSGSLQLSTTHARRGEMVTMTTEPGPGYVLGSLTVTDRMGNRVPVTDLGKGKWSFAMPASNVTVGVTFIPAQSVALPFLDVGQNEWFREAVAYVYGTGLMNGTSGNRFSPGDTTTRAMIVTILHRYEGKPAAGAAGFRDVPTGQYYTEAVAWAASTGVVYGYEGNLFKPDQMITREQLATILFRYAARKGLDVGGRADLSGYADAGEISGYALEAMAWANQAGLINGVDSRTLQPGGTATRAQVATILMRFCQNVAGQ